MRLTEDQIARLRDMASTATLNHIAVEAIPRPGYPDQQHGAILFTYYARDGLVEGILNENGEVIA